MGPADPEDLRSAIATSPLRVKYLEAPDRESAHEVLSARLDSAKAVAGTPPPPEARTGAGDRSVFGTLHVSRH